MSDTGAKKPIAQLTARDTEILVAALQNLKNGSEIEVDYTALAGATGLKDQHSARTAWAGVKKKLLGDKKTKPATAGESAAAIKGKTPKSTTKKPKSEAVVKEGTDSGDGGDDDGAEAQGPAKAKATTIAPLTTTAPKKRGRKTKAEKEAEAAAAAATAGEDPADGEADELPIAKKPRKTPAKKTAYRVATGNDNDDDEAEATTAAKPKPARKRATPAAKASAAAADQSTAQIGGLVDSGELAKLNKRLESADDFMSTDPLFSAADNVGPATAPEDE